MRAIVLDFDCPPFLSFASVVYCGKLCRGVRDHSLLMQGWGPGDAYRGHQNF